MSSPAGQGTGSGAERRRYVRLPIKLDALVAIDGRPPIPCTVRDFCVAGLFIAIPPQQLRLAKQHSVGRLYFSLVVDGVQKDFELTLKVYRIVGGGFGCGFENPDPDAIALLQDLANSLNKRAFPETAEDLSRTQQNFSPLFTEVKEPLRELVRKAAEQACDEFIRAVDDALFIAARDAANNLEETRFLDGQSEIRGRNDDIKKLVPDLLEKGVTILDSPLSHEDTGDVTGESALSELSLIDKDEFEEFLTVSQLVSELEPKFKDPLYQLERRFSVLANRDVDERNNPIGPAVIGGAFAEALKNLESDRSAIHVVYRSLRQVLESNLDRLYARANELLVEFGVLPVIEKEKPKFKRPPGSDTSTPPTPDTTESTFSGTDSQPQSPTMPPPGLDQTGGYTGAAGTPHVQAGPPPQYVPPPQTGPPGTPGAGAGGFDVVNPGQPAAPQGGYGSGAPAGVVQPGVAAPAGAVHGGAPYPGGAAGQPVQPGYAPPAGGGYQGAPVAPGAPSGGFPPVDPGVAGGGQVSPGVPSAPGQQPGNIAAGQPGGVPMGLGLEATFGGFGTGPAVYVPPSLQQAFSAAQTQLALRRELVPQAFADTASMAAMGSTYAPFQIIDGLTHLQNSLGSATNPQMLDVGHIKERIVEAITGAGGEAGVIGQSESDAIEVIANLFEVLIDDALLTDTAKSQLARLQAPVHKAALMDQAFFEATDHPMRQLLNRVSMLKDSRSEDGQVRMERVSDLISQINAEFNQDMGVLTPVLSELEQILREQRDAYEQNVASVVQASEQQAQIIRERREKSLDATDSSVTNIDLPEEWNRWLDRSKLLEVGERLIMNANTNSPYLVTLAWVGPEFNPFVFVDDKGEKTATLTLQQVAMYLRRGTLRQLVGDEEGPVDRALFGVVNRMHGEVEVHATQDPLTEFLNRKTFQQSIERVLPEAKSNSGPVLCQIVIDDIKSLNDKYGVEFGDEVIEKVATIMRDTITGKSVTFGRLGGTELGILWSKGGLQSAYKKVQKCFDVFADTTIEKDGETISLVTFSGITAVEDGLTSADQLLTVVNDACKTAKETTDKPIYVVGSENKYKEQLEQMVSYIGRAYDRERLVLLNQLVTSIGDDTEQPAVHMVITAEDRNGKLVPPGFFSQALANSDRAFEIDRWVLSQTFSWMAENIDDLDNYAAVIIPLSHLAIKNDELSNIIINELMETAVPPGKILFEVADKDVIGNVPETAELVRTLREFGCRFILDEFGTGQRNYDYVKELAVDFVTIESTFIADATNNPKDFAMAKSINELVHFMGKKTIAKQASGTDVIETLREIGVDFIYDQSKTNRLAA